MDPKRLVTDCAPICIALALSDLSFNIMLPIAGMGMLPLISRIARWGILFASGFFAIKRTAADIMALGAASSAASFLIYLASALIILSGIGGMDIAAASEALAGSALFGGGSPISALVAIVSALIFLALEGALLSGFGSFFRSRL
ncbi:MAG: hypothetical protein V1827_01500 [Candidatus Micrarchaeota archaeon]